VHRLNPQSSRVTVSASWIRQRGDLAIAGGFLYDKIEWPWLIRRQMMVKLQ
jgi:hypothetical protein